MRVIHAAQTHSQSVGNLMLARGEEEMKGSAWIAALLWLPEKGSHIVFTWPFLHFLTLPAAAAAKLPFQFKSDLEFKCVSHPGLHLGRPNFPRQPPTF